MVGMNGIPKALTPQALAQRVADLERTVEQLTSARTYVNIGNIVEGGTIDANVGTALTETVQKEIVIERQNLAEAALTDVVVTGSITSRGATSETPPRPIDVSLTTFSRSANGAVTNNAGIVFVAEGQEESFAPGVYSPDGRVLTLATMDGLGGMSYLQLGAASQIVAPEFLVGPYLAPLLNANSNTNTVTVGIPNGIFSPGQTNVNLLGNVKVNGKPLTQIQEFRATGTKANFDTANQDIGTLAPQTVGTNSSNLVTPGAGAVTITETGVYSVDFQFLVGAAVTGRSFVDIADGNGTAYSRTAITVGEDQATGTLAGKLFNAGDRLRFRAIQTSGASRNYTAIIRIIKHP